MNETQKQLIYGELNALIAQYQAKERRLTMLADDINEVKSRIAQIKELILPLSEGVVALPIKDGELYLTDYDTGLVPSFLEK
jgi:hypothetical protein